MIQNSSLKRLIVNEVENFLNSNLYLFLYVRCCLGTILFSLVVKRFWWVKKEWVKVFTLFRPWSRLQVQFHMGIPDMYIDWNKLIKSLAQLNDGIYFLSIICITWSQANYIEGFFWGIFQDLITKVLFEKSYEQIFEILIYFYIDEFYCFKIIKTYTN